MFFHRLRVMWRYDDDYCMYLPFLELSEVSGPARSIGSEKKKEKEKSIPL